MALAIIFVICATAMGITIVITSTDKEIRTKESYWKAKYETEHNNSVGILQLNREILDNTKDVLRINKELHVMLNERFKKEEQTDQGG